MLAEFKQISIDQGRLVIYVIFSPWHVAAIVRLYDHSRRSTNNQIQTCSLEYSGSERKLESFDSQNSLIEYDVQMGLQSIDILLQSELALIFPHFDSMTINKLNLKSSSDDISSPLTKDLDPPLLFTLSSVKSTSPLDPQQHWPACFWSCSQSSIGCS